MYPNIVMGMMIWAAFMIINMNDLFSQVPSRMSYQAALRDNSNQFISNRNIRVKISLLTDSMNNAAVYSEFHLVTTNETGVFNIQIGGGTVLSGIYANIPWSKGKVYLKSEIDPSGGTNYSMTNVTQLLSVPYANFSGNGLVGVSIVGDTLKLGDGKKIIVPGISLANNKTFHSCGADSLHNPSLIYDTMKDQQGNIYKTVKIGNQSWMAENLRTTIYRNGDSIPYTPLKSDWANTKSGAWCYYNNDPAYDCPYGKMYNWYTVSDSRNVCPSGWHVPNENDWNTLIRLLDPSSNNNYGIQSQIAGDKMKSASFQFWSDPKITTTNSTGFAAIPGGQRFNNGDFGDFNNFGCWWSENIDFLQSWIRFIGKGNGAVYKYTNYLGAGFNIRCIKD